MSLFFPPEDVRPFQPMPEFLRQAVNQRLYSQEHAIELARLPTDALQRKVANEVKQQRLSLLRTRQLVGAMLVMSKGATNLVGTPKVEYRGGFDYSFEERGRPRDGLMSRLRGLFHRLRRPSRRPRDWSDQTSGPQADGTQVSIEHSNSQTSDSSSRRTSN